LSLPNGWLETTNRSNLTEQLALLWKMTTGDRRVRRAAQARLTQQARRLQQGGDEQVAEERTAA
ncbi:MAG TPA: hypothetical protein VF728_07375, partial [Nocardioides sp.]